MNPKNKKCYYEILDVAARATQSEILHAYKQAKEAYSDSAIASYSLVEDDTRNYILEEVELAYEILGDPSRRKQYDNSLKAEEAPIEEKKPKKEKKKKSKKKKSKKQENLSLQEEMMKELEEIMSSEEANEESTEPAYESEGIQEYNDPEFDISDDFEREIQSRVEVDGLFLQTVRNYRHYTSSELARLCKVSVHHIEMIEGEEIKATYHPTYILGHVGLICQELGIPNARQMAKTYVNRLKSMGKLPKASI